MVADRIRGAVRKTDLSHTADIERELFFGNGLLWVATCNGKIAAAAITVLTRTDKHLICMVTACAGNDRDKWLPLFAQIETWAKAEGAAIMRIFGRPGWSRVLKNYRVKNVVLERAL